MSVTAGPGDPADADACFARLWPCWTAACWRWWSAWATGSDCSRPCGRCPPPPPPRWRPRRGLMSATSANGWRPWPRAASSDMTRPREPSNCHPATPRHCHEGLVDRSPSPQCVSTSPCWARSRTVLRSTSVRAEGCRTTPTNSCGVQGSRM